MWNPLKLKLEECTFFAQQLEAYSRHPKMFLFFLSAFISSARTVTFHIQKQFPAESEKEAYAKVRDDMLADDVSKFFRDLRNEVEKEGYPELIVSQLVARRNKRTEQKVWIQLSAKTTLFNGITELLPLESLIRKDWETINASQPPVQIKYIWKFPNFPGGSKEVVVACRDFSEHLWEFVFNFRALLEQSTDAN